MNDSTEYFTPKLDGQGDGLKRITIRKRHAVDSSRKFNARAPRDESFKLKLEKALVDMKSPRRIVLHSCIQKANTVAEITPTKTKTKKKPGNVTKTPSYDGSSSDVTLFATPRPFDNCIIPTMCQRQKAVCLVYQRLMLCAWRRYRSRHTELAEVYDRQLNTVNQLELQIDVLSSLRNSECEKRHEAMNACHRMKLQIEEMSSENHNLKDLLKTTTEKLDETRVNLILTKEDLQRCSEQLKRVQNQMKKKMEEKMDLVYKLTELEREVQTKNGEVKSLEEKLSITELNLRNSESNVKVKHEEVAEVLEQLQNEVCLNQSLKEQIGSMKQENLDMEQHSRFLENELNNYISTCEELTVENKSIRNDLDSMNIELENQKKRWYQKVRNVDLAKISEGVLRNFGSVIIPILLDRRVYF